MVKLLIGLASTWIAAGASAAPLVVAEYRADLDATVIERSDSSLKTGLEVGQVTGLEEFDEYQPLGLIGSELGGSVELPFVFRGTAFTGILDFRQRQTFWADRPYAQSHSVAFGPSVSLRAGSETRFYYGYERESLANDIYGLPDPGDNETTRTGLAQIWHLGRRNAEIRLGYEFARADREPLFEDRRGHSVNVSSRFPLFWGLRASVAADYSRLMYPEYGGGFDLQSDRTHLRAAISRSFGGRFYGGMHISYLDEEFDEESPLSYRRHAWGLNLRYDY